MARRDLTNEEIEQMGREEPRSAAEYLRLRREELAAEEQERREKEEKEWFIERLIASGGTSRVEGEKAYEAHKNQQAADAARRADEVALEQTRRLISGRL